MFLVAGGLIGATELTSKTELYDPNTESWRFVGDLPEAIRKGFNNKVENFRYRSGSPFPKTNWKQIFIIGYVGF